MYSVGLQNVKTRNSRLITIPELALDHSHHSITFWCPLQAFGFILDRSYHVYSDLEGFRSELIFIYFSAFEYLCTNKTTLEYSHHKSHVILPKTYFGIKSYEMVVDNFSLK